MANKFCASCGAPLDESKKFCTECGQSVTAEAPAKEPVMAGTASAAYAPAPDMPPAAYAPAPDTASAAYAPAPDTPSAACAPAPDTPSAACAPAPDMPPAGRYAPIGLGRWLGILLLLLIPIVNIILLIVWACGGCKRVTQRSFARAALVFMAVMIVLGMVTSFFVKKAVTAFIDETGIVEQFGGIPGLGGGDGIDIGDLFGALLTGDPTALISGALAPGEADALEQLFPDGKFDEQTMIDQGYTEEDIAVIRAVMENDRDALLDMGYTEQEIDMLFKMFR